jgi:hypothetical protein
MGECVKILKSAQICQTCYNGRLKGTICVRLSQLSFTNPIRPIDKKIITNLKRVFKIEGCLQNEKDYSVPAIISEVSFNRALSVAHVSAEDFKTVSSSNPAKYKLPPGITLECLHGQHRVLAATEYLPRGDGWWLVDIYGQGMLIVLNKFTTKPYK